MTITETLIAIRSIPFMSATFNHQTREYRIAYRMGSEASAYYTNDPNDALKTAQTMSNHKATWNTAVQQAFRLQSVN